MPDEVLNTPLLKFNTTVNLALSRHDYRSAFRTQSNIYDGAFFAKIVNVF